MEQLYKSREWFGWADQLTHFVQKHQNYALEAEKVYAVAGIHYNIAQNSEIEGVLKPQNVAWEMRQKQQIRENLLTGVRNGLSLVTRKNFIGFELVNALSNVLSMLEPNIRSVNPSLLSKIEQKALQQCVGTFVDFGLSLKSVKNEETMTYNMVVEPPLKIITRFPDECKMAKRGLTQQTKLLISSEIEREKVRRMHQNMNRGNSSKTLKDISNTGTPKKTKSKECVALKAVIRPKPPKIEEKKIRRGGLSSFITKTKREKPLPKENPMDETVMGIVEKPTHVDPGVGNSQVYFSFNAGYSNAVRQKITIEELLKKI